MPHATVAIEARDFAGVDNVEGGLNECRMAVEAVGLHHIDADLAGADVIGVGAHGEDNAVIEAVFGFGKPLANKVVRHVAIITACYAAMAGMPPLVILGFHDVAIDAGFGVIGEVGEAFGVIECKPTQTKQQPT